MEISHSDRFVRLPTKLMEALLPVRLSGIQWRILVWVSRHTYGWGRGTAPYSWYLIARQIHCSRSQAFSEGRRLLSAGILVVNGAEIGIQSDSASWNRNGSENRTFGEANVRDSERFSFGNPNALVRNPEHDRSEDRTLSRRAKERCKERERKKETREQDSAPEPNCASLSQESANPLVRVMDFYGAFRRATLKEECTKIFDLELATAATALLDACSQNADEAIQVIERIGKQLNQEGQPWSMETVCRYCLDPSLMNSCGPEKAAPSTLDDRFTIREEIP